MVGGCEFVVLPAQLNDVPRVCEKVGAFDPLNHGGADDVVHLGLTLITADLALACDLDPISRSHDS